jgi:hypothetical protein
MTVGRIANEGVTTERAILLRKEIVIHLRPAATLEIKTKMVRGVGRIQELARSEGRPAVGNHRRANHDPDTSPCAWQTCFLLPKYLLRSGDLRLGRSHCAMCRGATAQRAKVFAVHGLQTRRRGIEVPAIGRGLQRRSQHPLDHETGRNKDTF